MSSENSKKPFEVLLVRLLENDITDREIEWLNKWIEEDPRSIEKYCDFLQDYTIIQTLVTSQIDRADSDLEDTGFDKAMWAALSEFEKNAPEIEVACPSEAPQAPVQKIPVKYYQPSAKFSKFRLYSLIVSAVAVFLMIVYLRMTPPNISVEVATIIEVIDAKWANAGLSLQKGDRLWSNHETLTLSKGFLEIQTDRGVTLTIEGPAEFEMMKEADLYLNYGRVYAKVSKQGLGFTVSTSNSKVVDLGTEFGIKADLDETELHVLKGRTVLIAGAADRSKEQSEIRQGQARRVTREGEVREIDLKENVFVRRIDSKKQFIWRGQDINLADIVDGGNGFGTGRAGTCIDPATGRVGPYESMPNRTGADNYSGLQPFLREVSDVSEVDCVIVPGQAGGVLPITTSGLVIADFPELLGGSRWLIQTRTHNETYPFILNGITYGVEGRSALSMHATCGITFDLDKIRERLSGQSLVSFKTICGLNESRLAGNTDPEMTADVYVFLDDKQVYHHVFNHVKNNAVPIEIDLQGTTPRFMTLVVSCGQDDNKLDWCVLGEPVLTVQ